MPKPTILLADNDEVFLQITSEYLDDNGFRVLSAKNVDEAEKYLENEIIALAVIDYRLVDDKDVSDESGYIFANTVKNNSSIPRVILTRFDERVDYVVKSLIPDVKGRSIANNYLFKKDGLENMLNAINKTLANAKIFLCYAHSDSKIVKNLYYKLIEAGFNPWMDKHDLYPGENWPNAISQAIHSANFFIYCYSQNSMDRRGFLQIEMKIAMDILDEKLKSDIYFIPARLDDSPIVDEKISQLQWVDLYKPKGFNDLIKALRVGLSRN
jgi:CheY-like chemotaxis protein